MSPFIDLAFARRISLRRVALIPLLRLVVAGWLAFTGQDAAAQAPTGPTAPPPAPGTPPAAHGQSPGAPGTPPTSPFPPGVPFPVPVGPFPPGFPPPGFPPPGFPPPVVIIPSNTSVMPRVENLDQAIELLKSGDASYKNAYPPLSKLREWPVDAKRRNEVAGLLDPFLTAENATVRHYAQEAAKGWGTPKNVPTLLKLLDWQDSTDRSNGIRALAAIGGKEAAQAIASKLDEKSTHVEARRALADMGQVSEEFVWPYIGAGNDQLHDDACYVLGRVGTAKSLAKLRARRPERDSGRKSAVNGAIREMEKRLVKR